jgi:hypothetical protein
MALTEACYAAAILHVRAGAVSSIDDIRAQLRASPNPAPEGKPFFLLATVLVGALASGVFYYLFFMPVVVPLKPSPHLPAFHRVNPDGTPENPPPDLRVEPAPPNPSQYAGLSPRQAGKVADDVCFARAQARVPHWSKTPRLTTKELADFDFDEMPHFNELMTCLLSEAPVRYCSSGQRKMIAAEIAMYFRGMEYGNNKLAKYKEEIIAAHQSGRMAFDPDPETMNRFRTRVMDADPRVTGAIEARLRDGTLTHSERDAIVAVAPAALKPRFANVRPAAALCPPQPWWAIWRGW